MTRLALAGAVLILLLGAALWVSAHRVPQVDAFGYVAGERVGDLAFTDLEGTPGHLSDYANHAAVVLVMRDVGCPVSRRYGPRLARLEEEYEDRGVAFIYVNTGSHSSDDELRAEADTFGFTGRYVGDRDSRIAANLRATTTAEVFVLDRTQTLRYRGAIDDQYGITYTRPEARHHYLREALESVLAGTPVAVASTTAEGCHLDLTDASRERPREITYHNRISRIVQNNCQTCHRTGGVGPFPFERYSEVYGYRGMIQYVLEQGIMPPWFADSATGQWANDRRLSPRDRDDFLTWIAQGAPEGAATDAPLARAWVPGWSIGEPDAVLQIPDPFAVPAEGVVDYQYTYVKTDFPEDRWVARMEIRPTSPQVVHHVLVFVEAPNAKPEHLARPGEPIAQGGLQGYFAANVPGFQPLDYGPDRAKRLPKGAWLKFQLHYTPNGVATSDQTEIGFVFADGPPQREVRTSSAFNVRFAIPPGAPRHEVSGEYTFDQAGVILSMFPHMHVRGAAFRYDLIHPDGAEEVLLNVPRYDFNWQLYYEFSQPLEIARGSRIRATGWFDNSESNRANPDPGQTVYFGEQTFDEMMIGYFDWVPAGQSSGPLARKSSP